jgi:hypothetical protein
LYSKNNKETFRRRYIMSEKNYIYEKARLKKIKEQKRVAKILHPTYFKNFTNNEKGKEGRNARQFTS